jgi:Fic family protein
MYNWQQKNWPNFTYNSSEIEEKLYLFSEKTGLISGVLKSLPENSQMDTIVEFMVYEAIKTSEIEGEYLSRKDVMSSIRNNLGLNKIPEPIADKKAKGIGDLIYNMRDTYQQPLNKKQLFAWHKMLLRTGSKLKVGAWRDHAAPMQVVTGIMGKEKVHYEAPPSEIVPEEMDRFITWFNESAPGVKQ